MGNVVNAIYHERSFNYQNINNVPDHLLIEIFRYLDVDDAANCNLVCKRWSYLLDVARDRLKQLHILRISVDCRPMGHDVVLVKDHRNDGSTISIHGSTKWNTQYKIWRLTCDEFRICSPKNEYSRVAVDPTWLTTVLISSWRTLTRIYIFRANLFRLTERDVAQLSILSRLTVLSVSGIDEANAFTDAALEPTVRKGILEKLVLDETPLTDATLRILAIFCRKLTLLSTLACPGVTEIGVGFLVAEKLRRKTDLLKIICRRTAFDCERFVRAFPLFVYSESGRSLEYPYRKIGVHFT